MEHNPGDNLDEFTGRFEISERGSNLDDHFGLVTPGKNNKSTAQVPVVSL